MAKMTLQNLVAFATAYVAKAKQAGAWNATTDNILGLLDKVGKILTLDGNFQDKLPELNGEDLPLGKTIEEYFIDLTLPSDYDSTGATTMAPADPTVEDVTYNYTLGRKKVKTTERYDNVERAALTPEDAGNFVAKIMERLYNSQSMYEYAIKKQLLGNVIAKAEAVGTLSTEIAVPVDETTGEAFIKEIKTRVEDASFASEGNNLGQYLIGASPELTLYVKKGVMPSLEVDTLAGAFHDEKLAIPANVKVIDDFGDADEDVYAILIDPRGVKLHQGYRALRTQDNADGDFVNYVLHTEFTGFISKSTYVHVFKKPE